MQTQTTYSTSSTNSLSWLLSFEVELTAAIAISCSPHKLCIWNLQWIFYKMWTLCLTQSFGTSGTSGARIWHQSVWTWTSTISWAKTQVAGLAIQKQACDTSRKSMTDMQLKWSWPPIVDIPAAWQSIFCDKKPDQNEWYSRWVGPQKTNLVIRRSSSDVIHRLLDLHDVPGMNIQWIYIYKFNQSCWSLQDG